MHTWKNCSLLAAIMLATFPTAALSASGGTQLAAWCDARKLDSAQGRRDHRHLMGYVQGATDALIEHREACPPDNATVGHGVELVCAYVAAHRQDSTSTKFALTKAALAKAYSCTKR
jgi:hypothetical protein